MKAIVQTGYGPPDILRLEEVDTPVPGDDEVLVRVLASSVNFGNLAMVRGEPFVARFWSGLRQPKDPIPGSDIAGRVEAVGRSVTRFQPGDEVYGDLSECGFGAYAQYAAAPEAALAPKPASLSFEEAAAVPQAALVALQGLRDKGRIKAGDRVLINGASGGNGTFAVQIAKALGAEVTGVCGPRNLELVRSLGADRVIDYTRDDFTRGGQQYDLIFATAGYHSIFDYRRALSPTGIYVSAGGEMKQVFQGMLLGPLASLGSGKTLTYLYQRPSQSDLLAMNDLLESGRVKPVIDRVFPLAQTAEALRYYGEGHTTGKVAITVQH
ncbi:MAG: NAD(P)-dependent alcohol dehydrogenase [Anaerolineae bacterium]